MVAGNCTIRRAGPHAVITTPAEIDVTNADEIRQALLSTASQDAAVLIIDMSETTFCDSAGVHAIVTAQKKVATAGTQLRLVATAVLRIFTVTGIDQLIPVFPTLAAALDGSAKPAAEPPRRK